ncbi:MAG: outer membrane protein assembly factor BamA [Desulfobulbales bacterium]|nr:outer membrane protein assembly factor BamA [Desulfobulbales bacterium]
MIFTSIKLDGVAKSLGMAVLFAALATFLLPVISAGAAEPPATTVILPLKVNAESEKDRLTGEVDRFMRIAAEKHGLAMLPRDEAVQEVLAASWPPNMSSLESVPAVKRYDMIAVGSLTRLGDSLSLDMTVFEPADPAAATYFFKDIGADEQLATAVDQIVKQLDDFSKRHRFIAAIKVEGNRRIDSGAILRKVTTRPGDRFSPAALSADLKAIFAMGYFADIRILTEPTPQGHVVTFAVEEREMVGKITISGNDKIKEDELRAAIKIKSHAIVNDEAIRESIANIKNLYREDGYFNCRVTVEQTEAGNDRVDLTFLIDEGDRIFIREIIFTGNENFTDQKIKKAISSSEKGWFSFITDSGLLDKGKLEQDASRITAFYHNQGFVEAKISEPEIVQKENWFHVYFHIDEGPRYKCGGVELSGDLIVAEDVLRKMIRVDREEFFSRKVLREDVLRVTDFYADKGYAFAEVYPRTTRNRGEETVDLDFRITQGQLVTINRININGNTRTRDKVIRREIMLKEGGLFNASKLKESNQKLARLEFFEDVNISPEPGLDESQLDLNVEVKEKPTGKFSIGGGYSTVDKMTFMGEISENNLFGRGQKLSLQANISDNANKFNLSFTEPRLLDSKLLLSFSLYNWDREYDDYTKDSQGGTIHVGYPLWEKWRLNTGFGYDDTALTDLGEAPSKPVLDSQANPVTISIKTTLHRDTRDRMYGASKGSNHNLSVKYAGGIMGGDNSFTKFEASTSWFFPITKSTTFHPRLSAGQIFGNSEGYLPVFEKFYLGGLNSIRSFDNGQISPIEEGERVGGDKMWYANLEYIFPIAKTQGLLGVVFYDIGNVYATGESWQFSDYKHSTGAGIRWLSPIGPLRLEWGYNLDPKEDEDTRNWEFSIGGSF